MAETHSKGPFAVSNQFIKSKGQIIAEVFTLDNSGSPTLPQKANATLFAAAPDLLHALSAVWAGVPDKVRDAVDKAPGTELRNSAIAMIPVLPETLFLVKMALAKAGR